MTDYLSNITKVSESSRTLYRINTAFGKCEFHIEEVDGKFDTCRYDFSHSGTYTLYDWFFLREISSFICSLYNNELTLTKGNENASN